MHKGFKICQRNIYNVSIKTLSIQNRFLIFMILWQNGVFLVPECVQSLHTLFHCATFSHGRHREESFDWMVEALDKGRVEKSDLTNLEHISFIVMHHMEL